MRIDIEYKERFPEFYFVPEGTSAFANYTVDLPDEKIEWCNRVIAEFEEVQAYLESITPKYGDGH